jgi:hypothetical protein
MSDIFHYLAFIKTEIFTRHIGITFLNFVDVTGYLGRLQILLPSVTLCCKETTYMILQMYNHTYYVFAEEVAKCSPHV